MDTTEDPAPAPQAPRGETVAITYSGGPLDGVAQDWNTAHLGPDRRAWGTTVRVNGRRVVYAPKAGDDPHTWHATHHGPVVPSAPRTWSSAPLGTTDDGRALALDLAAPVAVVAPPPVSDTTPTGGGATSLLSLLAAHVAAAGDADVVVLDARHQWHQATEGGRLTVAVGSDVVAEHLSTLRADITRREAAPSAARPCVVIIDGLIHALLGAYESEAAAAEALADLCRRGPAVGVVPVASVSGAWWALDSAGVTATGPGARRLTWPTLVVGRTASDTWRRITAARPGAHGARMPTTGPGRWAVFDPAGDVEHVTIPPATPADAARTATDGGTQ